MHTYVYIFKYRSYFETKIIENGNDSNFLTRYLFLYRFIYLIVTSVRWIKLNIEKFWSVHVFYGRCGPLFKIFVVKREIHKRYPFTWFSSRTTSFDAHIEKRKREREGKSEVSGNERTQSICKCVHLLSRVWAIDGRLSRSCRGCSFDFNAQWTSHGISASKHYKRCINNINNEMRILSLPRWLLHFNLDNSSKLEEVKIFELWKLSHSLLQIKFEIWNLSFIS